MDQAVLFERDTELARLVGVIELAASATGSIAVLSGEPGSGKTSLVRAVSDAARRGDVRVVDDVLGDGTGELPLVVVVEDLHLADELTLSRVADLARRVGELGCGLLVTARPGPPASPAEKTIAELIAAGADVVPLQPLPGTAVARLVSLDAGGLPGPRLRARLDGAAGNPLLVRQFVRSAMNAGAIVSDGDHVELDGAADPVPFDPPPTIAGWLGALSSAAAEVLQIAAVLEPCTVDWLGPILECSPAAIRKAVCEATAAGLLDPTSPMIRFRHELLREVLQARVSTASQTALHRQLGRQLAAAGAPPAVVARHLELGSPALDAETIRWIRRAATDATVHDPEAAAELFGRALSAMSHDDPERSDVLAQRARTLLWVGRPAESRNCAADALTRHTEPATRARLRAVLAEASLLEGRPEHALAEVDLAVAAGTDDEIEQARFHAQAAATRLWAYDVAGAEAEAARAVALGTRVGDPVSTSQALSVSSRAAAFQLDLTRAVRAGEESVARAGDVPAAVRGAPHLYLGLALLNADRWERAGRVLEDGRARCEAVGATWAIPRFQGALAVRSFFTGEWDEAVAAGEIGSVFADRTGCRAGQSQIDAVIGLIAHHRGDDEAAAAACRRTAEATAAPGADRTAVPYLRWLQALRTAARGDLTKAVSLLHEACSIAFQRRVPLVTLWLAPDLTRLAIAAGRPEIAEWIAGEVERIAPRAATTTAESVARFCRAAVDQDIDGMLAAAAGFEQAGRPLFAAAALEAAGGAAGAGGRVDVSVRATRRAGELYDGLGAAGDARRAWRQLRAVGGRVGARGTRRRPVAGRSSLTPSEQAVAALVADGLANAEIAERLYVSKRTVETHISRLYLKLQVTTRVGIARMVSDATEPVPA
jgi:DNA-binding CsgD family transcriptional regulator